MSIANLKKAVRFSDRLRAARLRQGLSQKDLAGKLGVSNGAVGNWETGPTIPRPSMLRKIENLLAIPIETLLHGPPAAPTLHYPPTEPSGSSPYAWMETATLENILSDLAARLPKSNPAARTQLLATLTAVIAELTTRESSVPVTPPRSLNAKTPAPLTEAQKIAQSAAEKYDRRHPRPPK